MRRAHPQLARLALGACACFVLARALSGFLEALAHEREERSGDDELERLCSEGHAASSQRMRNTCLQMHRARATPILIKACLRAVATAYDDFHSRLATWQSVLSVALFVLMCVASPLSKILWLLLPSQPTKALVDEEDTECRIVVMSQDDIRNMPAAKQFFNNMRLKFGKSRGGRACSPLRPADRGADYADWPGFVTGGSPEYTISKKLD